MFEILDTGDLRAVAAAMKDLADGDLLRKQLVKELGQAADPLVGKVRAAWEAAPSQGHATSTRGRQGQPDLRALLAKATRTEIRLTGKFAGVRVRTDGRRMPDGMKALPQYAEGTKPRWRHPTFGKRENSKDWQPQRPFPRFYQAVQPDAQRATAAAQRAVESVLDKIAKASG